MSKEKTLEDLLTEALTNEDIEFRVIVSDNRGKKRFYLISGKKEVVCIEVTGNSVKIL